MAENSKQGVTYIAIQMNPQYLDSQINTPPVVNRFSTAYHDNDFLVNVVTHWALLGMILPILIRS